MVSFFDALHQIMVSNFFGPPLHGVQFSMLKKHRKFTHHGGGQPPPPWRGPENFGGWLPPWWWAPKILPTMVGGAKKISPAARSIVPNHGCKFLA